MASRSQTSGHFLGYISSVCRAGGDCEEGEGYAGFARTLAGRTLFCVVGPYPVITLTKANIDEQLEIAAITDDTLSTTRRSAALPYSLLSIVAGDETLLSSAVHRLLDLARIDNIKSSDITKVHAFNILKIVLLDAKQSKFLHKFFEDTVMTAVQAFPSPK